MGCVRARFARMAVGFLASAAVIQCFTAQRRLAHMVGAGLFVVARRPMLAFVVALAVDIRAAVRATLTPSPAVELIGTLLTSPIVVPVVGFRARVLASDVRLRRFGFRLVRVRVVRIWFRRPWRLRRLLCAACVAIVVAASAVRPPCGAMAPTLPAARLRLSASGIMLTNTTDMLGRYHFPASAAPRSDAEVQKHGIALPASPLADAFLFINEDVIACFFTAHAYAFARNKLMLIRDGQHLDAVYNAPAVTVAPAVVPKMVARHTCVYAHTIAPNLLAYGAEAAGVQPIVAVLLAACACADILPAAVGDGEGVRLVIHHCVTA